MKFNRFLLFTGTMLIAACNPPAADEPTANQPIAPTETPSAPLPQPAKDSAVARQPKILAEPRGPIDPKSVEAAGQVVQSYGALIEQKRWGEAAQLWGDGNAAAHFARALGAGVMHIEIGELGETEGAAGSIYTSVPVTFYDDRSRRPANVILRRVNDVPGSTAAQRRWHIERIEWA